VYLRLCVWPCCQVWDLDGGVLLFESFMGLGASSIYLSINYTIYIYIYHL
jgi:hypothetical protein